MRVNGEQIPEAAIQAAVEFMREKKVFSNNQIAGLFGKHKVFESYRAADRLLQQQKKAGNIKYDRPNGVWRWAGVAVK